MDKICFFSAILGIMREHGKCEVQILGVLLVNMVKLEGAKNLGHGCTNCSVSQKYLLVKEVFDVIVVYWLGV